MTAPRLALMLFLQWLAYGPICWAYRRELISPDMWWILSHTIYAAWVLMWDR